MIDSRIGFLSILFFGIGVGLPPGFGQDEDEKASARLTWNNGESLPGEVVGATGEELTWKSSLFAKPVPLSLSALRSVTSEAEPTVPAGSMSINLRDGSRVYGDLAGIEGDWINVKSERHGELRIRKNAINVIHRRKGEEVLWCGPFGEAGWKYSNTKIAAGQRLQNGPGGSLQSFAWRQRSTLPLELPEKVEIEFHLRSSAQPEFEIQAVADKRAITLTTWKDELVLRRGNHFVSLKDLKSSDRELKLRLFWDRKSGSGMVSTADGQLLGKWQSAPDEPEEEAAEEPAGPDPGVAQVEIRGNMINRIVAAAIFPGIGVKDGSSSKKKKTPLPDGVSLTNRGQDLRIEFLRVREWDGGYPERSLSDPFRTRLELAGGSAIEGNIISGTDQQLVFRQEEGGSERKVPVGEIESIFFPAEPMENGSGKTDELRFADGTWLRGRLLGIAEGAVRMESPFSDEPVRAQLDGLRELNLRAAAAKAADDGNEPVPLAKQDRLVTGKTTIHGSWHPAAGPKIQWKLDGAANPVEVASNAEMELTRVPAEDGEWPRSPALFHLTNGQIAPGELVAIDGGKAETIQYNSELFKAGSFSRGDLHAIQFRGPEVDPEGFNDPGWQIVRGGEKTVKLEKGVLSIDPGGAWGHPSILVGDEIRFTMEPSGYSTLRVRLFSDGIDSNSVGTHILLAHYGSEIYCGLEETPGQLNQRRDVSVGSNKPAKVRISWDAAATKVFVNETMAIRIPNEKKAKRSGLGLILEPADLWGNGERQIKVSGFLLRAAPGVTWVPGVNPVAKERALFLPRFRKEDPPQHMLLAPNGDVLRGTIVAAAKDRIGFRSGLEELSIPRDRVAAAIWLKQPPAEEEDDDEEEEKAEGETEEKGEDEDEKTEPEEKETAEEEKPKGPDPTHWLLLTSGARLGLAVDSFGPEVITGDSPGLGKCQIPAKHIHLIRSTRPDASPASLAFSNWQLKKAPQPLSEPGGGENSPMVGNDAPEIDLAMLDGERFRLSEQKGKVIVLDFWATWCGPCVRAIPDMIKEFSSFDSKRMRFIGVNQAEAPGLIEPFIEGREWNPFEVALDVETAAGRAYGVEGIPHTVIVDHEGKVAWVSTGFKTDGAIEAAKVVRELLGEAPDDRTSRIMKAQDIEDVGIKPGRFDEFMASFLAELVEEDREKALEVFEKAIEIVNTSREREKWKFKFGDQSKSFTSEFIIHLRNKVEPAAWVAFQADLMRSSKVPPFELIRMWGEKRIVDGFVAADGKSEAPRQPIETSLKALGETALNPELYPLLVPLMVKVIQRYNGDTVRVLESTLQSGGDEELSPLLREIEAALDMQMRMREGYRGRVFSPKVAEHYLAALENDAVPLSARIRLADFLVSDATPEPGPELVLAGAWAIAEAWSGETPAFQFWNMRLLETFLREERDEEWKKVAKALGEGFRKRYLDDEVPARIPKVPDDTLISLMMDVYIGIGENEAAKEAFEKYKSRFADFEMPLIHLVRAGEHEAALELLGTSWAKMGKKWNSHAVYDDKLAKQAPVFLEKIERPSQRILAEALIANAKDPVRSGKRPHVPVKHGSPRSERLQALAKTVAEASFASANQKRTVLGILGNDVGAARIVAEDLREEADEINLDQALDAWTFSTLIREGMDTRPDLAVFKGGLLLDMADGKIDAVNAKLDKVVSSRPDSADRKGVLIEEIIKMPAQAILGSAEPSKTAEGLIPLCRQLALGIKGIEGRQTWGARKSTPWAQLTFALIEAGKMREFHPWIRETCEDEELEEHLKYWRAGAPILFQLEAEKFRGEPVEKRVAFLNQMLAPEWVVDGFHPYTNSGFRHSAGHGLIAPAELLEHGESMAEAAPRAGHAWNDLAYVFNRLGKTEEGSEFWEKSAKAMEASDQPIDAWRYRTNSARAAYHRLEPEEANEILKGVDAEKYTLGDFTSLRKKLDAGKPGVAPLEEWVAMSNAVLEKAPAISGQQAPASSEGEQAGEATMDEPDPFGESSKKAAPAAPQPAADVPKDDAMNEPDPFAPAPAKKDKGGERGDEPDPFGDMPKKAPDAKPKEKAKPEPNPGGAEPDPFAE